MCAPANVNAPMAERVHVALPGREISSVAGWVEGVRGEWNGANG